METDKNKHRAQLIQDQIDQYLRGELPANQLDAFEKRLESDTILKAAVEEQKAITDGAEEYFLRDSLDVFHREMYTENSTKNRSFWFAAAAAILVIIGVTSWALFFQNETPQSVFAENFRPDPGLPTTMGPSEDYVFYEGMVDYKRKKYDEALEKWQPLLQKNKESDTLNYFVGVAYLAKGNSSQASGFLENVTIKKNSIFNDDARYYLALSKINDGKISEAKTILEHINTSESVSLLQRLKDLE
ncbi:hypothetical protein [Aequorivita echinoideorum]|uniref:Tetratricopeptide repeat-containing protein n=1 Tax=Aequorivita echinoideorum TaxID=1549647 RepID=A0ABS5S244_9FLAO|nr:hypothetical protein [Aequorivita echinoideorum]MBT0607239.1 hypothetical protein [Aequorivita echinoideorum]